MSNTRISIPTKIIHKNFHTHEIIPTKNFHTHENKAYTYQQNFHTHWVLIISYPQKLSQNSSSNTTSYIQCKASQTINIVQISQYQTTQQFKKCQKKKKKTWPHNDFQPNEAMSKIPIKTNNNKMTISHYKVPNKIRNQQIYQQKKQKNKLTWNPFWMSVEHGCLGLEGAPLHLSILGMDDISSHWK